MSDVRNPLTNPLTPILIEPKPVAEKGKKGFQKGHAFAGGRKSGVPQRRYKTALEVAEKMGFHPVQFLATVALTGRIPNPDGSFTVVTSAERLDAAKAVVPYVLPKLSQQQVTNAKGGPVEVAVLDVNKLLSDPEAARAAQDLALRIAAQDDDPSTPD